MSAIGSRAAELPSPRPLPAFRWRRGWAGGLVDLGVFLFCVAMLLLMRLDTSQVAIPYHLLYLMLTLVYGFRVWPLAPTVVVVVLVTASTGLLMYDHYREGRIESPELWEIPLMPAFLVAMVWHARRRAAAQAALKEMAEHQWEMFERERNFFRNTSHAIRTPVTIARGHLELAERLVDSVQARSDVTVALNQLERMSVLSNRLLALAQLDSGETPPIERIRLRSFVLEVGRNWASGPRRDWVVDCPDDAVLLADPAWLGLAVDALVENAVHFTADGARVAISGSVTANWCTIRVSDDGPGIAAEDLEHVFERFWHRRPPHGPMGSGLGLAMALATAQACGGHVRASNADSGGAIFEMVLPRFDARSGTA